MKKSFILLSCVSSLLFSDINLNDKKNVDKLAIAGLKENIASIDEKTAGLWYLRIAQYTKWDKVRNDEFEIQDAITGAYSIFKNNVEKNQELIGQSSEILLNVTFQDYDFSKESFQIANLVDKNSYINFYGQTLSSGIKISFDNVKDEGIFLTMNKDLAKQFVQKRKNSWGEINRKLIAKYYFKIRSVSTPNENIVECTYSKGRANNCYNLGETTVVGHIDKIEILDEKGKIFTSVNY